MYERLVAGETAVLVGKPKTKACTEQAEKDQISTLKK